MCSYVEWETCLRNISDVPKKNECMEQGIRQHRNLPATVRTWCAFSPRTRKTTLRWDESILAFSSKKTRSTPYSCSTENLTNKPTGPASSWLMTRFFLPRACTPLAGAPGGAYNTHAFEQSQQVPAGLVSAVIRVSQGRHLWFVAVAGNRIPK